MTVPSHHRFQSAKTEQPKAALGNFNIIGYNPKKLPEQIAQNLDWQQGGDGRVLKRPKTEDQDVN